MSFSSAAVESHKGANQSETWREEATAGEPYVSKYQKTPPWQYHMSESQSSGVAKHMVLYKFERDSIENVSTGTDITYESYSGEIRCTLTKKGGQAESEKCYVYPVAKCVPPGGAAHR